MGVGGVGQCFGMDHGSVRGGGRFTRKKHNRRKVVEEA